MDLHAADGVSNPLSADGVECHLQRTGRGLAWHAQHQDQRDQGYETRHGERPSSLIVVQTALALCRQRYRLEVSHQSWAGSIGNPLRLSLAVVLDRLPAEAIAFDVEAAVHTIEAELAQAIPTIGPGFADLLQRVRTAVG